GGAGRVEDAATPAGLFRSTEGLIVGEDRVADGQGAGVEDAGPIGRPAVGDRQVGDGYRDAAVDLEDSAGVTTDGQLLGGGAVDLQVIGDVQLAAGQGDGAAQPRGEVNPVGAGQAVGVQNRLPQRTGAAVSQVQDCEGAGQGPALQGFQPGHEARSWVPSEA